MVAAAVAQGVAFVSWPFEPRPSCAGRVRRPDSVKTENPGPFTTESLLEPDSPEVFAPKAAEPANEPQAGRVCLTTLIMESDSDPSTTTV